MSYLIQIEKNSQVDGIYTSSITCLTDDYCAQRSGIPINTLEDGITIDVDSGKSLHPRSHFLMTANTTSPSPNGFKDGVATRSPDPRIESCGSSTTLNSVANPSRQVLTSAVCTPTYDLAYKPIT